MEGMKAIILAGGFGVRLKPFTEALPKPMLPIGNKPILEILIRYLKVCGFDEAVITTNYLKGNIKYYFRNGNDLGIKIRYSEEMKPLGTAGGVKKAARGFKDPFLVMVSDGLADIDYDDLFMFHNERQAAGTMVVFENKVTMPYGLVNIDVDQDNTIIDLVEKPEVPITVNTGITVLGARSLEYMEEDEFLRMPDLFLRMKEDGEKVVAYQHRGNWIDVGQNLQQYLQMNQLVMNRETKFSQKLTDVIFEGSEGEL